MNTRHILLCLALSLLGAGLQAQTDLPQVFSPNAAELGKYGKIPVSYFNGLPNITIPLTELRAKNYTLPIYLTYHAGGNKPDQHPGWVGLGWTLHAGGCINRIVNVKKDEMSRVESIGITGDGIGHLYHSDEMSTYAGLNSVMNRIVSNWDDDDYAPDEFVINTDDIQASFYIVGEDDIRIVSKSNADFTVQFELETEPSNYPGLIIAEGYDGLGQYRSNKANRYTYFKRFVVTGKDGTRYIFGGDDSAIEFSTTVKSFATVDEYNRHWAAVATANTWYLKRIERPDGEVVFFDYAKEGKPMVLIDRHHGEYFHPLDEDVAARIGYYDESTYRGNRYNSRYHMIFLQPSYLSTIRSKQTGETITFDRERSHELSYEVTENQFIQAVGDFSTDGNTLGNLTFPVIQENDYYMRLTKIRSSARPEKIIRFHHTDSFTRRLTLQQIDFIASSPDNAYEYAFNYNETNLLPPYNAKQTDYWGYYNGRSFKMINGSTYSLIDALRSQVDPLKMQAEILTSICYPTGGRSEFMYEPHDYGKVVHRYPFYLEQMGVDKMAGGLRIRSIIDYPAEGKAETRTFIYKNGNRSSGILFGQPQNSDGDNHYEMPSYFVNANGTKIKYEGTFPVSYKIYSEDAVNELSTTEGNHVTYSKVQEQRGDGSIVEYEYSNHDSEEGMDTFPSFYDKNYGTKVLSDKANSRELFRGLLIKKTGRNSNGDMCFTEENEYKIDTLSSIHSIEWKTYFGQRLYSLRHGTIFCGYPYLHHQIKTTYPDASGSSYLETTDYTYDIHRNLTEVTRTAGGVRIRDTYTYTGDYTEGGYSGMTARNMISFPVEHLQFRKEGSAAEKLTGAELVTWRSSGNHYIPSEQWQAGLGSGIASGSFGEYTGTRKDSHYGNAPELFYACYDSDGNLILSEDKTGSPTTYIWTPDGCHPAAIIPGARIPYERRDSSDVSRSQQSDLAPGDFLIKDFDCSDPFTMNLSLTCPQGQNWYLDVLIDGGSHPLAKINSTYTQSDWSDIGYGQYPSQRQVSIPSGTHRLRVNVRMTYYAGQSSDPEGCTLSFNYREKQYTTTVVPGQTVVFEDFEEDGNVTSNGYWSDRSHRGTWTHSLDTSGGPYVVDYRVFRNGRWEYKSVQASGTSVSINEGSSPIDHVRIYPGGSLPESYTWNDDGTLRSKTDARGTTESYRYDGLGRLTGVYDNEGHKVEGYQYNYKNR